MTKVAGTFELSLNRRLPGQTLANWLYGELRTAILEERLKAGVRLPASRDFAHRYHLSRGTVVNAFERLHDEGYLSSHVGIGTWVSAEIPVRETRRDESTKPPAYIRSVVSEYKVPKPLSGWVSFKDIRPFRMSDPGLADFPAELWGRIASRRARALRSLLAEKDDGAGYLPLRKTIADYLGSSRGVRCDARQVIMVSGVQQALDLLARFLLRPGDSVWMEDPGYFGATIAFERAGAKIAAVPVDAEGLSVDAGVKACSNAKGVYLTPAHQFPLGMAMSLERRMEVLNWAVRTGSFIIEDDYDSEYCFHGEPAPALQGLDRGSNVIFIGTFTKLLFPAVRTGYLVLPSSLVDAFVSFRRGVELRTFNLDHAVLCDFIVDGHFGRHLRRMRELYAQRSEALMDYSQRHLAGLLEVSNTRAGLYTAAFLQNGMASKPAELQASAHGVETRALDRFTLKRSDPRGLLLGFAAFDEKTLRQGVVQLAAALSRHQTPRAERGLRKDSRE
jgi:GntR family transcriptional regulator/MocR family aminotransferase